MKIFERDFSKLRLLLNGSILILSIYGLNRTKFEYEKETLAQQAVIQLVGPAQNLIFYAKNSFNNLIQNYFLLIEVKKENLELKKQIGTLEEKIFNLEELGRENIRLKELLQFGQSTKHDKVLAQIIGKDSSGLFKIVRINKGILDGITLKATVVTSDGLVGHIHRTFDHYSDIITILDSNNRVDGIVDRTRSQGIIQGEGNEGLCIMKYVSRSEPVQTQDLVLTSGLGRIYPKGIRIGRIIQVEKEKYGITQIIKLSPSVEFRKLEEVVVLIDKSTRPNWGEWEGNQVP